MPPTPTAARAAAEIADRVRTLNYATLPTDGCPGLSRVSDVHDVLDSLRLATVRLQQSFLQTGSYLAHASDRGGLVVTSGRYAGDPAAAIDKARDALREAERLGGELALCSTTPPTRSPRCRTRSPRSRPTTCRRASRPEACPRRRPSQGQIPLEN